MKSKYVSLMEKTLSAYTDAHILRYFDGVRKDGLTEHGFPRLVSNIGILIAHGKRLDLYSIFAEMMEFCCKTIPKVSAANDFSVREIIACLFELEASQSVDEQSLTRWKGYLRDINPLTCYDIYATSVNDKVNNWALFSAVSEYFRVKMFGCDSTDFIDTQLENQLQLFDENGMFKDNLKCDVHQPIMYDLVPRGLFAILLDQGYRGKHFIAIDENLKKSGILTLEMQSPNGEMAYGGRSNQFLHNEAWMIAVYEYEAKRYAREGNLELAGKFKCAAKKALDVTEFWLNKSPIRHVKNRFPTETGYGCEYYAYFDKYMITVASNLYAAYSICDDSIPVSTETSKLPSVAVTTEFFHKIFAKCCDYGIEFDLNADPHYDSNGLGRIHRDGAPSAICLSCPCPAHPEYKVDTENPVALSLCSAIKSNGKWRLSAEDGTKYDVLSTRADESSASFAVLCKFFDGHTIKEHYSVNGDGVTISLDGDGDIGYALPAFAFDGEDRPEISNDESSLTIKYDGYACSYQTNGAIIDLKTTAMNRNGYYQVFLAHADSNLEIKIKITKC